MSVLTATSYRWGLPWLLSAGVWMVSVTNTVPAEAQPAANEVDQTSQTQNEDVEHRLRLAREQLDEAAQRFARIVREQALSQKQIQNFEERAQSLAELEMQRAQRQIERAQARVERLAAASAKAGQRAMLGIIIDDSDKGGVVIRGVSPDSGAEQAGLQAGDRIVGINGVPLRSRSAGQDLIAVTDQLSPGDEAAIEYVRDGKPHNALVTTHSGAQSLNRFLGGIGESLRIRASDREPPKFSRLRREIKLAAMDANLGRYFGSDSGVLIVAAEHGSNFVSGDVLVSVNGATVATVDDAYRALANAGDSQQARVRRQGDERDVQFKPIWETLPETTQ